MPKSYKMRYHCQVLVDLNKHVNKNIIDNQHSGMVHEKHRGLTLGKTKNNYSTFSEVCQVHS